MAVTSQVKPSSDVGEVAITDWKKAGLLKPSVAKPVLATIEKSLIIRKLGQLEDTDRQSLQKGLDLILG